MSHLVYARGLSLLSNGILGGVGICMNFVSVPSIQASNDPLPVFKATYNRVSKIAVTNIIISSACHFYIYYKTRNHRAFWCGVLSFAAFPFTLLFVKPIRNQLFALEAQNSTDYAKINRLLITWDVLQYFRTITGNLAFIMNVFYY